jgi:hypothetical protein
MPKRVDLAELKVNRSFDVTVSNQVDRVGTCLTPWTYTADIDACPPAKNDVSEAQQAQFIKLKAEVASVINEHGYVLASDIVPNGTIDFTVRQLRSIWKGVTERARTIDEYKNLITKVVYTDDVRRFGAMYVCLYRRIPQNFVSAAF